MTTKTTNTTTATIGAVLGVLALMGAPAVARGRTQVEKGSLVSTGIDDDAEGRAKLKVRDGSDGRFEVQIRRLDGNASYEVLVDGVHVAQITTTAGGSGKVRFRSRPRNSRDELLGFDPRGALVAVRDGAGDDVLAVRLADSSSVDGAVICCVPDDSGPECEDRTPEECAAEGGTVSTATSCLPDPCAGVSPPAGSDVICCIPDDSGPECEDRTPAECAAQGGLVVEATSCDPNPCGSVAPPAGGDIQCCLPDDSGPECEDRTPAECAVEGGVNLGAGMCTLDSCASIPPPPGGIVRVRCERRVGRSKVSVDGSNLAPGSYLARVTSGADTVVASAQPTIGDEVEFDFDSDSGDIAEGATPLPADFIQGTPPRATGAILTLSGSVVAEATVDCLQP
jgi:hypothetical protein